MAIERMRAMLMQDAQMYPTNLPSESNPRFGHVAGVPVLTILDSRRECSELGLHTGHFAGISGSASEGAFSIVASGGYEDDRDEGDFLVYTGTGGQADSFSGSDSRQVSDQSFDHRSNMSLKRSAETKRPVRVIRGPNKDSIYAPESGYRYDGLYLVERAYMDKGKSGYAVCKFNLRRLPGQPPIPRKI